MKKILAPFILLFFYVSLFAQDEFITTWDITDDFRQLVIEKRAGFDYNYSVDWGDGTITNGHTGDAVHIYASNSIYTVAISGDYPKISIPSAGKTHLLSVEQWGSQKWQCVEGAFKDCHNVIINAEDIPDFSEIESMSEMFFKVKTTIGTIENWDVSNVKNMYRIFQHASLFNQDIGNWDVSNVTNMSNMFFQAYNFNQDIGNWNVSNVTDMSRMFNGDLLNTETSNFNQNIGNWNVSNVTDMSYMFKSASTFNQDIGNWNTQNVTTMYYMFSEAESFNQDIGNWNTQNVTTMSRLFYNAKNFNQDIGNWNVENVTSMSQMFQYAESFNQDIGNWSTQNVTDMYSVFNSAESFNQDIGNWDTQNVTDMSNLFNGAESFNQNIGNWDTQNVTTMSYMFRNAESFNQDIGNWNTQNVTDMSNMFSYAESFNQDIGNWNVGNVTDMSDMFFDAKAFSTENYDALLNGWATNHLNEDIELNVSTAYCIGEGARQYIVDTYNWDISDDGLSDDCERLIVKGNSFLESGPATCDNQLQPLSYIKYALNEPNNNTIYIANLDGEFALPAYDGEYTIKHILANPDFFEVSPDSIVVVAPLIDPATVINFCITPKFDVEDVNISIIPLDVARPGFDVSYKLILSNKGTVIMDGEVEFNYPSNLMSFLNADPEETQVENDKIIWEYNDLEISEYRTYFLDFTLNSPMDEPPLNDGDKLDIKATAYPLGLDINRNDNYACLSQVVVNSYDPNDKTCLEGSTLLPEMVGEYLHYQIRFENTGTADAINVLVTDVIDRSRFDISTLQVIDASHDMQVRIDGSEVEFVFDNIMLPFDDDNNDGYLVFKIKTLPTLVLGDQISNEANIFFDFNFPILTDPAITTVEIPSSSAEKNNNLHFQLFPNPASSDITISTKETLAQITIYDLQGRILVNSIVAQGNKHTIDLSQLNSGVYMVKVIDSEGAVGVKKFVRR